MKRFVSVFILLCFIVTGQIGDCPVYAQGVSDLPVPGTMVNLSLSFEPVLIKGLKVHPENPFLFDFIIGNGNTCLTANNPHFKEESNKLIKYFLAAMTVPEKDLWVNLSPYEKDRMITSNLGETQMGHDMLAQDYILKQLTASLIYPEKNLGKIFWDRVYTKAEQLYGTTAIPVNTFNKVWIVADRADVFEHGDTAYIIGSHLKVMLEEDYLALNKHQRQRLNPKAPQVNNRTHSIASQIVREIILPAIEQEVNAGKNFAPLRQMFYSMILASWYKTALKDAILTQIYGNKAKVKIGINQNDPKANEEIFNRYLKAYKKGVFNYIKEDLNHTSQQKIPRKYFSGGLNMAMLVADVHGTSVLHRFRSIPQAMLPALAVATSLYVVSTNVSISSRSLPDKAMEATNNEKKPMVSLEQGASRTSEHTVALTFDHEYMAALSQDGVSQFTIVDVPISARFLYVQYLWAKVVDFTVQLFKPIIPAQIYDRYEDSDLYLFYKKNSWKRLVKRLTKGMDPLEVVSHMANGVITIANNARSFRALQERLQLAGNHPNSKGILLVSGGGAVQKVFGGLSAFFSWPTSSLQTVRQAAALKFDHKIPQGIKIFVAWNPNNARDTVGRLREKIEAGAEGVITQPPLLEWERFKRSMQVLASDQTFSEVPILVGIPVFSSAYNVRFWFGTLLGIKWRENPEAEALVRLFEKNERELTLSQFREFRVQWTVDFIQEIQKETPQVAGFHIMLQGQESLISDILSRTSVLNPKESIKFNVKQMISKLSTYGIAVNYDEESLPKNEERMKVFYKCLTALRDGINEIPEGQKTIFRKDGLQTYWSWIAYENHFYSDVDIRFFKSDPEKQRRKFDMTGDLKQLQLKTSEELRSIFKTKLQSALEGKHVSDDGVRLQEDFYPHSQSVSWFFNWAFWNHVKHFMLAKGQDYRKSIGGSPDTNPNLVSYTAGTFLDRLEKAVEQEGHGSNQPFYYVEAGVASIDHPRRFIEELVKQAIEKKKENLLGHVRYVLTDFSEEILRDAHKELGDVHAGIQLEYARVEAENLYQVLGKYRERILRYHATNMFDNMPSDQVAKIHGEYFHVYSRLYLSMQAFEELSKAYGQFGVSRKVLHEDLKKLSKGNVFDFLEKYKNLFNSDIPFYNFWQDLWNKLKFEEEYVPIEDINQYDFLGPVGPNYHGLLHPGKDLKVLLDSYPGDVKMFLSNQSIRGILEVRGLLHLQGTVEIVDLMKNTIKDYKTSLFSGMIKYDGSKMAPVNRPVLEAVLASDSPKTPPKYSSLKDFGDRVAARGVLEISTDAAMKIDLAPVQGGIDFDRFQMRFNIKKQGQGVKMQFDPATIERIKREGFDGLEFHIQSIVPVTNLPLLLGMRPS